MIAKLIVHGADRKAALAAMAQALSRCDVVGPKSNVPFLDRLVAHPAVRDGSIDTGYLDRHLDEFLDARELPPLPAVAAAAAVAMDTTVEDTRADAARGADPHSPWALADGWRLGHASAQAMALSWREQRLDVVVQGDPKRFVLRHGDASHDIEVLHLDDQALVLALDGARLRLPVLRSGRDVVVTCEGRQRFRPASPYAFEGSTAEADDSVRAPMPGRIVAVHVAEGDTVASGQPLLVMEAMKMELTLRAPADGQVAMLAASAGEFVEADVVLVRVDPTP